MSEKVYLNGQSGNRHEFEVFQWGTNFNPVGGIYSVLKILPNGRYQILYIGQTGDLSERFENHHRANCFSKNGKTHIAVRAEGSEQRRLAIETDLIRNYQTCCNQQ